MPYVVVTKTTETKKSYKVAKLPNPVGLKSLIE